MNKKIKILLITLTSFSIVFAGTLTYSKYRNSIGGITDVNISVWNIKVNTEQINGKQILENSISPAFESNANIRDGVLAPGGKGYYDIVIDSTDVDVAFSYLLTCENSIDSTIADLIITGYQINPLTNPPVTTYTGNISGNIALTDSTTTIRIFIEWDDSATASMDNAADTAAVIDPNVKALIDNSVQFTQMQ